MKETGMSTRGPTTEAEKHSKKSRRGGEVDNAVRS